MEKDKTLKQPLPPIIYIYGVCKRRGKSGLKAFTIPKGSQLPSRIIEQKEGLLTHNQAQTLAGIMRKQIRKQKEVEKEAEKNPSPVAITPGTILVHNDREGTHFATILAIKEDQAHALFLTSNPDWGHKARLATEVECCLFGLIIQKTDTYIVPVIRPLKEFFAVKGQLPPECLREYQEEFLK